MAVTIYDSRGPLDLARIERVEAELGCVFPREYRGFLLAHNGGKAADGVFAILDPPHNSSGLLDQFLCISSGDDYDLSEWAGDYAGRLPPNLLPVAVDQAGNLITLSVAGSDVGRVYFWDHELEAGMGEAPSYDNVYPVADDFQGFLDSLQPLLEGRVNDIM